MAFGFPAHHEAEVQFSDRHDFFQALEEVLYSEGVTVKDRTRDAVFGKFGISLCSWGERIEIVIGLETAQIRSRCSCPVQCIDWGKNRRNVERIVEGLQARQV